MDDENETEKGLCDIIEKLSVRQCSCGGVYDIVGVELQQRIDNPGIYTIVFLLKCQRCHREEREYVDSSIDEIEDILSMMIDEDAIGCKCCKGDFIIDRESHTLRCRSCGRRLGVIEIYKKLLEETVKEFMKGLSLESDE